MLAGQVHFIHRVGFRYCTHETKDIIVQQTPFPPPPQAPKFMVKQPSPVIQNHALRARQRN